MDAVATWVHEHEGTRDTLPTNHRSRPELVNACSVLFARALARHGFSNDEVVVTAQRTAHEALQALPPFGVWLLDAEVAYSLKLPKQQLLRMAFLAENLGSEAYQLVPQRPMPLQNFSFQLTWMVSSLTSSKTTP